MIRPVIGVCPSPLAEAHRLCVNADPGSTVTICLSDGSVIPAPTSVTLERLDAICRHKRLHFIIIPYIQPPGRTVRAMPRRIELRHGLAFEFFM